MDPSEVEFLAEKETVKIIPNFSLDKIYLIGVSSSIVFVKASLYRRGLDQKLIVCQLSNVKLANFVSLVHIINLCRR